MAGEVGLIVAEMPDLAALCSTDKKKQSKELQHPSNGGGARPSSLPASLALLLMRGGDVLNDDGAERRQRWREGEKPLLVCSHRQTTLLHTLGPGCVNAIRKSRLFFYYLRRSQQVNG